MTTRQQLDEEAMAAAVGALVQSLRPLVKRKVGTLKPAEARQIAFSVVSGWIRKRAEQHLADPVGDLDAYVRDDLPFDDDISDIGASILD